MTGEKIFRPQFVNEADYSWLGPLIAEFLRFKGRTRSELAERLREPFPFSAPAKKLEWAKGVCSRLICDQAIPQPHPRVLRDQLFVAASERYLAAARRGDLVLTRSMRTTIFEALSERIAIAGCDIEAALFSDLPERRIVAGFGSELSPSTLALKINLAICQHYLTLSRHVTIRLRGEARRVVRQAKFKGLICVVTSPEPDDSAVMIDVSGPFSLFRFTRFYGRSLGTLVPFLAWCPQFVLDAHCEPKAKPFVVRIHSGDPIFPNAPPPSLDSKVEARFVKDFLKRAPAWDLVREPKPLRLRDSQALIYPDFALVHRTDPTRFWYVEIVGFWTPEYLAKKYESLRQIVATNFIVCFEEAIHCAENPLPDNFRMVRFKKRINIDDIFTIIEDF